MSNLDASPWFRVLVLSGLALFAFTPGAMARSRVVQPLTATSAAPAAHGHATFTLKKASKGRLLVRARGLAPKASFDLVVGGVKVGSFTTNAAGRGKIKLSTHPKGSQTLLGVDPRGRSLSVRDENGDDQLEGDMSDGENGSATGAFACCKPDHDETECEVEASEKCAAHGGATQSGVDSCIPNPCAVPPPGGGDVVCCFPGSSTGAFVDEEKEAGCDQVSEHECALAGGAVVAATSCEPNPCAAVPPPEVTVCCVPEEGESECEVLTPDHCTASGGTAVSDATSCMDAPCGGGTDGEGTEHSGSHPDGSEG
jgi:hypothetical protein